MTNFFPYTPTTATVHAAYISPQTITYRVDLAPATPSKHPMDDVVSACHELWYACQQLKKAWE